MPATTPASDQVLQSLAQRGAQTWGDNAVQAFMDQWSSNASTVLDALPAGPQRTAWEQRYTQYLQQRHNELMTAVSGQQPAIATQTFAALQALNPRPTDLDLAVEANADQIVAQAVAGTAAALAVETMIATLDALMQGFGGSAAPQVENVGGGLGAVNTALLTIVNSIRTELLTMTNQTVSTGGLLAQISLKVQDTALKGGSDVAVPAVKVLAEELASSSVDGTVAAQVSATVNELSYLTDAMAKFTNTLLEDFILSQPQHK